MRQKTFGSEDKAKEFVKAIYANVPVLDTGARGSTITFVERGVGDVFLSWENEAFLAVNELGKDKFEIVVPSVSILAEPPVAVVDKNVDKKEHARGGRGLSELPLHQGGPGARGEELSIARAIRRSRRSMRTCSPKVQLFTIDEVFGGWRAAQTKHFADKGVFDEIYSQ